MSQPTHRGQIVFREAQGSSRNPGSYRPAPEREGMAYFLALGCIETDAGGLPDETVLGFTFGRTRDGFRWSLGDPQPQEQNLRGCDVSSLLTHIEVRSPEGFGSLVSHGGLHFRRTRFPSPEGRETYVVAGLLRSSPDLPQRVMFGLSGEGRSLSARKLRDAPETFVPGSALSTTLNLPIWGFGPEPRGFRSTLALDVIDEMKEYVALKELDAPDAAQRARIDQLARSEGASIVAHRYDRRVFSDSHDFARWRAKAAELGTPLDLPPDSYLTAAETAAHEQAAMAAMRAMMAEKHDEAPSFRP